MDANQRGRRMDVAHDQGYGFLIILRCVPGAEFSAKSVNAEGAPAGGEVGGSNLSNLKRPQQHYSGMRWMSR